MDGGGFAGNFAISNELTDHFVAVQSQWNIFNYDQFFVRVKDTQTLEGLGCFYAVNDRSVGSDHLPHKGSGIIGAGEKHHFAALFCGFVGGVFGDDRRCVLGGSDGDLCVFTGYGFFRTYKAASDPSIVQGQRNVGEGQLLGICAGDLDLAAQIAGQVGAVDHSVSDGDLPSILPHIGRFGNKHSGFAFHHGLTGGVFGNNGCPCGGLFHICCGSRCWQRADQHQKKQKQGKDFADFLHLESSFL